MAAKRKVEGASHISWPRAACAFLVGIWFITAAPWESFAQDASRKGTSQTNGFPSSVLLASDIPLFHRAPCCGGRLDLRAQLVVRNSTLFWADSSDTPIKKMPTAGGEITPLVRWTGTPINAVLDGDQIYWIEHGDGPGINRPAPRLNRTSLDGAKTTVLDEGPRAGNYPGTADILIHETTAYWVNAVLAATGNVSWLIRKVPLDGDLPTTLVTTSEEIVSLATDGTYLYWQEAGDAVGESSIKRMPLGGGEVTVVVDGFLNGFGAPWHAAGGMTVEGTEIFFTSRYNGLMKTSTSGGSVTILSTFDTVERFPRKLALDETNLYWVDQTSLNLVPRNGGVASVLANGLGLSIDLLIRDGYAIWAEAYCCGRTLTGSIKMVPTSGGAVTTIVSGLDGVRSLDADSATVYFIEGQYVFQGWESGRLAKVSRGGGAITTLASAVMADFVSPIAVDDRNVYFADGSGLKKVSINGGVVEILAVELMIGQVSAIATDGKFVYWLPAESYPTVRRISVDGGPIETIVPPQSWRHIGARLVLDSGYLYWTKRSYSVPPNDAIIKAPVEGGPTVTVVSGLGALDDLAVAGNDIYFSEEGYPTYIRRVSVDGGPISTLAPAYDGNTLAADNESVYWANYFDIFMMPKGGGTQTWVAGAAGALTMVVDETGIYWLDAGGNIVKVDRSSIDAFVNIRSPSLGEIWPIRSKQIISWMSGGINGKLTISLSRDGGITWATLARNVANKWGYRWKVAPPATTKGKIRVCTVSSPSVCDTSNVFTIR